MINEILCASLVRVRDLGGVALVAAWLSACGATAAPKTEADLNAAVRRIQLHEAAIAACACAPSASDHAGQICAEAEAFADGDLRARCNSARRATTPGADPAECGCD